MAATKLSPFPRRLICVVFSFSFFFLSLVDSFELLSSKYRPHRVHITNQTSLNNYRSPFSGDYTNLPVIELDSPYCNVDRILAKDFSDQIFQEHYKDRKPVIIVGATDDWVANQWKFEYLMHTPVEKDTCSPLDILLSPVPGIENTIHGDFGFERSWKQHFQRVFGRSREQVIRGGSPSIDGVAFDRPSNIALREGFERPSFVNVDLEDNFLPLILQHMEEFLLDYGYDANPQLGASLNSRFLITAPAGAGGSMHVDYLNTSFWNGLVYGQKRWLMFSADDWQLLGQDSVDEGLIEYWLFSGMSAYEFFTEEHGGILSDESIQLHHITPFECFQDAGDLLYSPGGWPHVVATVQDSLTISEQQLNENNFRGCTELNLMEKMGLYGEDFFDINIELLPISINVMAMVQSTLSFDLHNEPFINLETRLSMCVDRVALCGAFVRVRPDLYESFSECHDLVHDCFHFLMAARWPTLWATQFPNLEQYDDGLMDDAYDALYEEE